MMSYLLSILVILERGIFKEVNLLQQVILLYFLFKILLPCTYNASGTAVYIPSGLINAGPAVSIYTAC